MRASRSSRVFARLVGLIHRRFCLILDGLVVGKLCLQGRNLCGLLVLDSLGLEIHVLRRGEETKKAGSRTTRKREGRGKDEHHEFFHGDLLPGKS